MKLLIQIQGLSKNYGPQMIFSNANASFSLQHKVGVIGRNGSGKSTLCRMIIGEERPDSGAITNNSDLRLGYLEQHNPFELDETVEAFLTRHSGLESWRCGQIAGRFQLKHELFDGLPIGSLSGGFQTRIKLAALLLAEPNFLILDEPTNFLDLDTQLLLERVLQDFKGGFLIVSHDREFLKRTSNHTLDVGRGELVMYPGKLEAYFAYREEQIAHAQRQNKKTEARRRQLQAFVDRNRVRASTAKQAQSKLKQLSRLESIEIEHALSDVDIRLPQVESRPGHALLCENMAIGYPEKSVAKNIYLDIERGAKVAVVGANGEGKTTLLRTLAGQLEPLGGSFKWSSQLEMAYYAQHVYGTLPEQLDVETYLRSEADAGVGRQQILDLAGSFLFQGDDVQKKLAVLSGGERARLCLAGLLLSGKPLLLLDEPTNHLDFETVEALGFALRDYGGTVFFTSHDRTFASLVATCVIEVKDERVAVFPGDYASYVYRLERWAQNGDTPSPGSQRKPKRTGKTAHAERKQLRARLRKLKNQVSQSEKRLASFEAEQALLLEQMVQDPAFSRERNLRLAELKELKEQEEERWLELQEQLEELET